MTDKLTNKEDRLTEEEKDTFKKMFLKIINRGKFPIADIYSCGGLATMIIIDKNKRVEISGETTAGEEEIHDIEKLSLSNLSGLVFDGFHEDDCEWKTLKEYKEMYDEILGDDD